MKKFTKAFIIFLALVGAINWGLMGSLNLDIVILAFGRETTIANFVYLLISLASLWVILKPKFLVNYYQQKQFAPDQGVAVKQVIDSDSPLIKEQEKFISEGGNSQPLDKDL